jgi:hypothetical protein
VKRFLGRDDGSVRDQREMNPGIRHQVRLEFCQVHVECAVETQGSGNRRDYLTDEAIQVGVSRAFDVQISATDVVNCFVVDHECAVRVL